MKNLFLTLSFLVISTCCVLANEKTINSDKSAEPIRSVEVQLIKSRVFAKVIQEGCTSGLKTEGNRITGYWFVCPRPGGGYYIRTVTL